MQLQCFVLITGFQNKDLKACLIKENYFSAKELKFPKKLTAKVSRIIAKLRAHKLIYKVANSCKYYLEKKAKEIICEILSFKKLRLKTT